MKLNFRKGKDLFDPKTEVKVLVLDTLPRKELFRSDRFLPNQAELPDNRRDDDGDGFVDNYWFDDLSVANTQKPSKLQVYGKKNKKMHGSMVAKLLIQQWNTLKKDKGYKAKLRLRFVTPGPEYTRHGGWPDKIPEYYKKSGFAKAFEIAEKGEFDMVNMSLSSIYPGVKDYAKSKFYKPEEDQAALSYLKKGGTIAASLGNRSSGGVAVSYKNSKFYYASQHPRFLYGIAVKENLERAPARIKKVGEDFGIRHSYSNYPTKNSGLNVFYGAGAQIYQERPPHTKNPYASAIGTSGATPLGGIKAWSAIQDKGPEGVRGIVSSMFSKKVGEHPQVSGSYARKEVQLQMKELNDQHLMRLKRLGYSNPRYLEDQMTVRTISW